ncbi:MAG: HU family DNA-binding protein [Polyangiaceae bacterium]
MVGCIGGLSEPSAAAGRADKKASKAQQDLSTGGIMAGKRLTKAQVVAELANASDLDKKSVARVFESLQELIRKQLSARGPGEFVVPGLVKLRVVKKPATKERQGINPFTKEPITIPAKPASKKVRATALKALKDLVQ